MAGEAPAEGADRPGGGLIEGLRSGVREGDGLLPLRHLRRDCRASEARGLLAATAEGVGLGLLGIGLPDVVLLVAMLLRGVYTTALRYGCTYEGPRERLLILRVMEASVSRGEDWRRRNAAKSGAGSGGACCCSTTPATTAACG